METTRFHFHLVIMLSLAILVSSAAFPHMRNITTDQSALLALKSNLFDPSDTLTKNWTSRSVTACNWIGVKCSSRHQRVVALNISYLGLHGHIPQEIGKLSFLNFLDIRGNNFQGNLPEEMMHLRRLTYINLSFNNFNGEIPSWFGSLPNLQYLFMLNTSFTGNLPLSLFNASKLEELHIQLNGLQGNIPQEIGNLRNFKILNLQDNQLTGSIPPTVFNLSLLEVIALANNSLTGTLPVNICSKSPKVRGFFLGINKLSGQLQSRFGNCSEIQILTLPNNNCVGGIPKELGNLTMLRVIALGRNYLEGEIPSQIGNSQNLERLNVVECGLTGPIPREIGNLQKLGVLALSSNYLSGPIPASIFNISTLGIISLSANHLSGSLPKSIGYTLPNLEELYLGGNKLSGIVLDSISNLTYLNNVGLSFNQFTGSIPRSLGNMRFLETLILESNNFTTDSSAELSFIASLTNCRSLIALSVSMNPLKGVLPSAIGNFSSSLQAFSADSCGIEGIFPNEIGNLSGLFQLSLANNLLRGSIPKMLRGLWNLQLLFLHSNKLQGSIPNYFCSFKKLGMLQLSGNQLSGQIPECIGNMTSLRNLNLHSNGLNSTVPASIGSLKDLLYLDVHSNSFSGYIPPEIGNLKAALSIDLSNNSFSGNISATIGGLQNLINISLAQNELQGSIPETLGNMVSLELLDLSHNNLTGEIPMKLESLLQLKQFDVSFNHLGGKIPKNGSFMNFTYESFMSNEAFCGGAARLRFPPCPVNHPRGSMTKRWRMVAYILLPTTLTLIFSMVVIVLVFMKNRRKNRTPAKLDLLPPTIRERVSYYELENATNCFNESNLLATGSYSSVYKGVLNVGTIVAIKVFNLQLEGAFKSFDRECEVLRNIRHRNLVKVISSCSNLDFMALILEYMPKGSLEKWLHSHNHFLSFLQRLDIMIDVAVGLDNLHHGHSSPIVHCDLKPNNVLLDEDMTGHVSDFGVAKLISDGESMAQTKTLATIGYIAPEYGSEGIVSTRCDVYSFGILMMETFSRKKPTDEMFAEDWGLKEWVMDVLQKSATEIIDHSLMTPEDKNSTRIVECASNIMKLALICTTESTEKRVDIKDALEELRKIRIHFVSN